VSPYNPVDTGEAKVLQGSFVEARSEKSAMIISITVEKLESRAAEVAVNICYGREGASFFTYTLKLDGGQWKVAERKAVGAF
jgi:hypothetical protein